MGGQTVLVTGGCGFLGGSLVRKFIDLGWEVRVFDDESRGSSKRLADLAGSIAMISGDIRDADAVTRATKGVDAVAHLAYVNGTEFFYSKPDLVLEVGVAGALNTINAAIRHEVGQYWLMSSSEVYQTPDTVPTDESVRLVVPDPQNPRYSYGGGKIISELMALHIAGRHLERVVIVRPHNVYGPEMGWEHVVPQLTLRAIDACRSTDTDPVSFPIQGDGTQTRAFVYIDDFTEGCSLAFLSGETHGIYHVGTEEEVTIRRLCEKVFGMLGREAELVPTPLPEGGTMRRCPDTTRIRGLGYAPKTSLDEGLRRTVEWYAAHESLRPH